MHFFRVLPFENFFGLCETGGHDQAFTQKSMQFLALCQSCSGSILLWKSISSEQVAMYMPKTHFAYQSLQSAARIIPAKCLPTESMEKCVRGTCRCMKFPTDAEIQFHSKHLGPLIPVRVGTVIRLQGSPTHIRTAGSVVFLICMFTDFTTCFDMEKKAFPAQPKLPRQRSRGSHSHSHSCYRL